jgi:hypothetical protein
MLDNIIFAPNMDTMSFLLKIGRQRERPTKLIRRRRAELRLPGTAACVALSRPIGSALLSPEAPLTPYSTSRESLRICRASDHDGAQYAKRAINARVPRCDCAKMICSSKGDMGLI